MNIRNNFYKLNNFNNINSNPLKSPDLSNSLRYQYNLNSDCISFKSKKKRNKDDELNTIKKLYSDEYYIKPKKNREGYYRTTVINKETDKPKIIYVKRDEDGLFVEKYGFYERNMFGKYKQIGNRSFGIDKEKKHITSGAMRSDSNEKYAGIGIRGHQLAVERMLQEGCENVYIYSVPEAFPFHYKCGFRPTNEQTNYPARFDDFDINGVFEYYSKSWNVPKKMIERNIDYEQRGENIYVNEDIFKGKLAEDMFLHNKNVSPEVYSDLKLSDESLRKWKQRANSQPILCD